MKRIMLAVLSTSLVALAFTASTPSPVPAHAVTDADAADYSNVDHVDVNTFQVSDPLSYDDGFTSGQADALTANGCSKHHRGYEVDAYNHYNNLIWSFGGYLQDCVKNGMVVHKNWGACWGYVPDNPLDVWAFKGCGIEDQSNQSLPRSYIWRQWRGHFKFCVVWYCKTKDPWVYIGGRGDGTFGTNGGA